MDHRREIDGLRAVAVLPVILFHAGLPVFPGGYAGVDVFFVISGYLITTLLVQDHAAGRYSIARFYERRARRILPALFVVMAATVPLAFLTMLPAQIEDYSTSLAAVVLFVSNLWFLSQVGYFAPDAELQPLLHTWSLAVEEQYYLLFPPALALLWRGGVRRVALVLAGVAVASLVLAQWGAAENPGRNFYFTLSRVWELLAGSLVALALHRRAVPGHDGAAALGLAMILGTMILYGRTTPFPALPALVPVAGTALVILFARPGTWTARLLGLPVLVGIGLVSYSAYLWHQPLFAFARLTWVAEPPVAVMAALAVLSLGLAWATWAFVEQPFRRKGPLLPARRHLFGVAALVGAGVLGLGLAGKASDGLREVWRAAWPGSAAIMDVIALAQTATVPQDDGACRFNVEAVDDAVASRLAGCIAAHGPGIAVLGDSHAIDLYGIVTLGTDRPFVAGFTKPSCRPGTTDRDCPYDGFRAFAAAHPGAFDVVVFEMSGAYLLAGDDGVPGVQTAIERLPLDRPAPDLRVAQAEVDRVVTALADLATVAPLVWLGPRIEPQVQLQALVGRGCAAGLVLRAGTEANFARLEAALRAVSDVPYLSQTDIFGLQFPRDMGGCDGLLWSDGDHFSAAGEAEMARRSDVAAAARALLQ